MTDVLIRDVPEETLRRLDSAAASLRLSRGEYLKRLLLREAPAEQPGVTRADLQRSADLVTDVLDPEVMAAAWR